MLFLVGGHHGLTIIFNNIMFMYLLFVPCCRIKYVGSVERLYIGVDYSTPGRVHPLQHVLIGKDTDVCFLDMLAFCSVCEKQTTCDSLSFCNMTLMVSGLRVFAALMRPCRNPNALPVQPVIAASEIKYAASHVTEWMCQHVATQGQADVMSEHKHTDSPEWVAMR